MQQQPLSTSARATLTTAFLAAYNLLPLDTHIAHALNGAFLTAAATVFQDDSSASLAAGNSLSSDHLDGPAATGGSWLATATIDQGAATNNSFPTRESSPDELSIMVRPRGLTYAHYTITHRGPTTNSVDARDSLSSDELNAPAPPQSTRFARSTVAQGGATADAFAPLTIHRPDELRYSRPASGPYVRPPHFYSLRPNYQPFCHS
jgi:hypothetical protein